MQYVAVCVVIQYKFSLSSFVPNLRFLSQGVAEKSLSGGVTEGNIGNLNKEDRIRISILIFICTLHFAYLKVYTKFENTGSNRNREIFDRNYIGEKGK